MKRKYAVTELVLQAKDKEQAVFHLYRIYNLQPVKYENLRPEKPQVHLSSGAVEREDEDESGEGQADGADADEAASTRKTRSIRTRKMKANSELEEQSKVDRSSKKRRKAQSQSVGPIKETDNNGKETETSVLTSEDLTSLMNQEDVPQPVDDASASVIEAEEHPEAIEAAVKDGDGCGVSEHGKSKKGGDRSRKSKGKRQI